MAIAKQKERPGSGFAGPGTKIVGPPFGPEPAPGAPGETPDAKIADGKKKAEGK